MLISVITPVYKVEKYLPQCIESILTQTVSDFELLLVDDGSPDGSGAICDRYAARDARIRVFHTPNRGVCAARNLALDHARGKYVYFIDSDDWIEPGRLEQLLEGMTGDGIVFGGGTEVFPDCRRDYPMPDLEAAGGYGACARLLAELFRRDCFGWVWCKLFSREIIERHRIRFSKEMLPWDDEIFTAQYCRHIARVRTDSRSGYCYRFIADTLSRKKSDPVSFCGLLQRSLQRYEEAGYDDEMCYIAAFRALAHTRRMLRRREGDLADWNSEASREVIRTMRIAWKVYRRVFRWRYVRTPHDLQYATLVRLSCTPPSDRWLKWMILSLKL